MLSPTSRAYTKWLDNLLGPMQISLVIFVIELDKKINCITLVHTTSRGANKLGDLCDSPSA